MKSDAQSNNTTCKLSREDLKAHQWFSRAQRVSWLLMTLVLLAALTGLLGKGPLSQARAGTPGDVCWIEYERFLHYQAGSDLKLHFGPAATQDGALQLLLSQAFAEGAELSRIYPIPERVVLETGRHIYVFKTGSNQAVDITFSFEPNCYGRLVYEVGLAQGPVHRLKHFVFP